MQRGRPSKKKKETVSTKKECKKCKTLKSIDDFCSSRSFMHPDGTTEVCKSCTYEYLQNNDLNEILVFLAHTDLPFKSEVWFKSAEQNIGKYVQKLQMMQYKKMTFKDSDNAIAVTPALSTDDKSEKVFNEKWLGEYTSAEIDYLEDHYNGLERDFKIITTSHKDYAKKICKSSLHMDKCFQEVLNNVSGADTKLKTARETFDTLSKSAQFSESQRGQNDASLGSFGVTFEQVEQNQWVAKHIPLEFDEIDKLLNQFSSIKESV